MSAIERLRQQCATSDRICGVDRRDLESVLDALDESVKLQSHYANLLNMYDGGERMQFKTADEWMKRLEECRRQ
jgi:hypothetical protein